VEKVEGMGSFTVTIRKPARNTSCTGCGILGKCPKKVVEVYEAGLGYRKAIYTPSRKRSRSTR
jgi:heterodisulfide reductase subunit A-like polyferredoxin